MNRAALAALVVAAALAAAFGAISFFSARDDATTGVDGEISAPGQFAQTREGLEELLRAGNVVIEHPGGPERERLLQALATEVSGSEDTAALRGAGQAVEVRRSAGASEIVAYAWQREYRTADAADPRLRVFVEYWLGRGAQ